MEIRYGLRTHDLQLMTANYESTYQLLNVSMPEPLKSVYMVSGYEPFQGYRTVFGGVGFDKTNGFRMGDALQENILRSLTEKLRQDDDLSKGFSFEVVAQEPGQKVFPYIAVIDKMGRSIARVNLIDFEGLVVTFNNHNDAVDNMVPVDRLEMEIRLCAKIIDHSLALLAQQIPSLKQFVESNFSTYTVKLASTDLMELVRSSTKQPIRIRSPWEIRMADAIMSYDLNGENIGYRDRAVGHVGYALMEMKESYVLREAGQTEEASWKYGEAKDQARKAHLLLEDKEKDPLDKELARAVRDLIADLDAGISVSKENFERAGRIFDVIKGHALPEKAQRHAEHARRVSI